MSQTPVKRDIKSAESEAASSMGVNEWQDLKKHPDHDISTIFDRLANYLSDNYGVEKGVMVVCGDNSKPLGVVSVWDQRGLKSGLTLTLPTDDSLFQRIVDSGESTIVSEPDELKGNFFEQKLLLEETTRSMLLIPLSWEGHVVGLIGFSSSTNMENPWSDNLDQATEVLAEMVDAQAW